MKDPHYSVLQLGGFSSECRDPKSKIALKAGAPRETDTPGAFNAIAIETTETLFKAKT